MYYRVIFHLIGNLLIITGLAMIPSFMIGLYYQEIQSISILVALILTYLCGHLLKGKRKINRIMLPEAFFGVTICWVLVSLYGSLPYLLSRSCGFINAFFESISGFTTTGATIFPSPKELPKGILLWRSTTQWLGGLGIILLYLVLQQEIRGHHHLFYAQSPFFNSPPIGGVKQLVQKLWIIYLSLTTFLFLLLISLGGLTPYEALLHSLTTISTGGFSPYEGSIGFSQRIELEYIIILFMILSGISFSNYSLLFSKEKRRIFKNPELLLYLSIILMSSLVLTLHLYNNLYPSFLLSFRLALFQTTSMMTTTGFSTIDYDGWSSFSRVLLILLMMIGGSSGSTAGGIKVMRIYLLMKLTIDQLGGIMTGKRRRETKEDKTLLSFFFLYLLLISFFTLILSYQGLDLVSAFSASIASLGNIGPGLNLIGPKECYSQLKNSSKMLLTVAMILGRLEIYTVLIFIILLVHPPLKPISY